MRHTTTLLLCILTLLGSVRVASADCSPSIKFPPAYTEFRPMSQRSLDPDGMRRISWEQEAIISSQNLNTWEVRHKWGNPEARDVDFPISHVLKNDECFIKITGEDKCVLKKGGRRSLFHLVVMTLNCEGKEEHYKRWPAATMKSLELWKNERDEYIEALQQALDEIQGTDKILAIAKGGNFYNFGPFQIYDPPAVQESPTEENQ